MKHVKRYQELFESQTELTPEQTEWLDKCTGGKWTLNPQTGLVDVSGGFNCSSQNLTDFKGVRFGVVTEHFKCGNNKLTSLEGAPQKVGRNFSCSVNKLASLEGAPQEVGDYFACYDNELTSLEGAPKKVRLGFNCGNNKLTSLKDAPQEVGGYFNCSRNNLTSLKGAPKKVGEDFWCHDNELTSLKDAPQEVGGDFWCYHNELTSLEGAPQKVGGVFYCSDNPVSGSVLKSLYKKMQSGMSWSDAVISHWRYIRSEEDKIMLATSNSTFPDEIKDEIKGYKALAKLRKRML
jgi:hypothetical protein